MERYALKHGDAFRVSVTEKEIAPGIEIVHLTADAVEDPQKLTVSVSRMIPDIGVHALWSPTGYHCKTVMPNWGPFFGSCAMSGAPVMAALDYQDRNRITLACSDVKNGVWMHTGLVEETGCLDTVVKIDVDYPVAHYEADIRIDTRGDIPFYRAVQDVAAWWETYEGLAPAPVPLDAKMPLYSAWYSYHQMIDVDAIVEECRRFSEIGCRVLIVDDGWQTDDNNRGYAFCGDWQPSDKKIPDMREFVRAVHDTGMKFMLWYSVPFVGENSEAYARFRDKLLCPMGDGFHALDPRFPEVRRHLIDLYKNAVLAWDLDGFKLDFVDAFRQADAVREGMDCVSVYDGVDRLLKGVMAELRAIKPDILIEFRQSYMGPLMRTFGNLIRVVDCPCDSYTNRMGALSLRMTSGNTAVHSDMVMWNYDETPEQAAFQLTNVLFCVPQISVKWSLMSEGQRKMVSAFCALWLKYRDVLMNGTLTCRGYANNFPYVSARLDDVQVGAVYAGRIAALEAPTSEVVLVNASLDCVIYVECAERVSYRYTVYDCMGEMCGEGSVSVSACVPGVIGGVPVNGTVVMKKTDVCE